MNRDKRHQTTSLETTYHKSATFMDYLHGDVDEEETELACRYEYCRESKAIREVARLRDKWKRVGLDEWSDAQRSDWKKRSPTWRNEKAAIWAYEASQMQGQSSFSFDVQCFLVCKSFPKKDWNGLTQAERKAITRFERKKVPPLPMADVWTLKGYRVFDEFNEMAEKARPVIENVRPGEQAKPMRLVFPILHKWQSVSYALFTLDYSKSETQLVNEFREWLRLTENRQRLEEHKKPHTGTTGGAMDKLKALAAWRLYRVVGNDWKAANDFSNKHRKNSRPFHDARQGQSKKGQRFEADLGSEESYFLKAQRRALDCLAEYFPDEFRVPSYSSVDDLDKEYIEELHKATD